MDWNRGLSAEFYCTFVDPITWEDTERFEITGGTIQHVESSLRESASLDTVGYEQSGERWIRVWFDARQGGSSEHVPLFTGLAVSPEKQFNGNLENTPLQCYSVLKPAEDVLLPRGWYVQAGRDGADAVKGLLDGFAPVGIDGVSPKLASTIVAEDNESKLTMAEKILLAMGWWLRIDGYGSITICPYSTDARAKFDPVENDSIQPQLTVSDDWFGVPNVYRCVENDNTAVAKDESDTSPFSIQNRGREVWANEQNSNRSTNETLAQYAKRRLKEAQAYAYTVDYTRAFRPDLSVGDIVSLNYPAQGVVGLYKITSQSMEVGYGVSVSEKVKRYER